MEQKKTSLFSNGLIWFGAAVSIAEILTGALIAPLGMEQGILAILLGHAIGCVLLFLSGLIGAKTGRSAMETVKLSFGAHGSLLFSTLNVLQLVGWTAVMIASGAAAASTVLGGGWVWCVVIGGLIALWIAIGARGLERLNTVAMICLFGLTLVLRTVIFSGNSPVSPDGTMTFGAAVELSVAMPLSWLPLISDYTRHARRPVGATLTSAAVYFAASCWMYVIGLGAAIFTGETDVASLLVKAGLGAVAIVIVIFSTVTTTWLDVYSAGVSSTSISAKIKEKPAALIVCAVGTVIALLSPSSGFEDFLYLIGSVFAPMIAVQIADRFVLRNGEPKGCFHWINLGCWLAGFILYRILMNVDIVVGNTLPVMLITGVLCVVANKCLGGSHAARHS